VITATDVNAPPTFWTQREIDEICYLGESIGVEDAKITGKKALNYDTRHTEIAWLKPMEETFWIYEKLWPLFYPRWQVNRLEPVQFSVYRSGSHFDWHNDNGLRPEGQLWTLTTISSRVASAVINLSRPEDYDGGDLYIKHPSGIVKTPNHRGSMTMFTSCMYHKVTPVTRGIRKTLVCWALR
jgi:PKHD-type hydroxylase